MPADIRKHFAELADADPAVRDEAMTALMSLHRSDLPALRQLLVENAPIAPAQAQVMHQIVAQIYLSGDAYDASRTAGFVGISTWPFSSQLVREGNGPTPTTAIIVTQCMPGFAGARVLREGDLVLNIAERPGVQFTNPSEFSIAIRELGPGATVHLTVLRQGRIRQVSLTLDARPLDLDDPTGSSSLMARRAQAADQYWADRFAPLLRGVM